MTTISEMLGELAVLYFNGQYDEYEALKAQIESYYVPRPPGSVLVTQGEHDTLTAIASFVDQWKPYLYEGGVPLPALNELDGLLRKWRESLPQEAE